MAKFLFISIFFGLLFNIKTIGQKIVISKNPAHSTRVNCVAYSPDGKYLIAAYSDNTIKVFDLEKGKPFIILNHHAAVNGLSFSPDGKFLASCSNDSTVKIWDAMNWKELHTFPKDKSAVKAVSFSRDGKIIASGAYQTIKLWNVKTFKEIKSLSGHSAYITSLSFSNDGQYLVSGCEDFKIKLWDIKTKEEIRTFDLHTGWINSVCFSPDSKFLASGSADKTVRLWDIQSRKKNVPISKNSNIINSVSFSLNGKYLASAGSDKKIKLRDMDAEKNIRTLNSNVEINCIAFSPDGKFLASGNEDGSIMIWEIPTGKKLATILHLSSNLKEWIVYTPSGKYDGAKGKNYMDDAADLSGNEPIKDNNYFPGLLAEIAGYKQLPFERIAPSIVLNSDSIIEVSQSEYEVSGTATDENGVLLISVNGKKATMENDNFSCQVNLNKGVNVFQILVYDRLGNNIKKGLTINYKPSSRHDYALIFYESDYSASNLPNLKGTKKNADSLADILQNKYGFETSVYANYSASQIKNILDKYNKKSYLLNDQLLIYFTGHGQKGNADTTGYLLCANNSRMSHKEFNNWSGIDSCNHVLMILDACYSGLALSINMIGDSPPAYNPRTRDEYLNELFKFKPARKALTSGEGKVSIPFDGVSEFTEALINALKNNHGKLFNILTYHELKAKIVNGYPKMETGKFSNEDESDGTFIFINK